MRTIDDTHPFAIAAHVAWPRDAEKRKAFFSLISAAKQTHLETAVADERYSDINPAQKEWIIAFFEGKLDRKAVYATISSGVGLDALYADARRGVQDAYFAGASALFLISMIVNHVEDERLRKGPSLVKAQKALAKKELLALTTLKNAWQSFSSIAPLAAACVAISDHKISTFLQNLLTPPANLPVATGHYAYFLTTFVPHSRKSSWLRAEDLWVPRGTVISDWSWLMSVPRLPDDILQDLD
ncbi:hypothetical protein [Pseudohoeflea coraliihabitans]|uniref:Uncharacterized protein n=1 Tax=Pseudohoeflea coraliihabitans TaxID=2860393 RepID=A0ABS6WP32_9HYPH|nr:hypothetical protein [Pseudohoeflea sp. DP4N28-3]MBW3097727.1 hypothetical protein [Pseudohoeflea sp. DP4N28-3]